MIKELPDLNDPDVIDYLHENGYVKINTDENYDENDAPSREWVIVLRDGVKRRMQWGFLAHNTIANTMSQLEEQFDVRNVVHLAILTYALCLKDMEEKIVDAMEAGDPDPRRHFIPFDDFKELLPADAQGMTDLYVAAIKCFSAQVPDELVEAGQRIEAMKTQTAKKRKTMQEDYSYVDVSGPAPIQGSTIERMMVQKNLKDDFA